MENIHAINSFKSVLHQTELARFKHSKDSLLKNLRDNKRNNEIHLETNGRKSDYNNFNINTKMAIKFFKIIKPMIGSDDVNSNTLYTATSN